MRGIQLSSDATVLAIDVGTTSAKMGIYRSRGNEPPRLVESFSERYQLRKYNNGRFVEVDPQDWKKAVIDGCAALSEFCGDVDIVALSGTTPALTAIGSDGEAVYPAILMLDQRSREQCEQIERIVGTDRLLNATGNMPAPGGCSLASILWIRENEHEAYRRTTVFGHSNTYICGWLSGRYAVDPSSASLTALYNTTRNDLTWNTEIAAAMTLSVEMLPELIRPDESPGRVKRGLARQLGLSKEPPVLVGGNDAVLAAYAADIVQPGQVINVNGTAEITLVCLPRCLPSTRYNVRAHVVPDRWLTLYVMNAGGEALEWFRALCCSEMSEDAFYSEFIPASIEQWLGKHSSIRYEPYLMGSRYSTESLSGAFTGLTRTSTREELLAVLVRDLCLYQREHLKEISMDVAIDSTIHVAGGAAIPSIIRAKQVWLRNCRYAKVENSSMLGAALLAQRHLGL